MWTSTLSPLFLLIATAKADSWGSAWSLGPTHGSAAIIQATTHFSPGLVPNPRYDALFIWPGTSNGTSGLIQAGCDSYASNSFCGANADQWCCGASYFGYINGQLSQWSGKSVPVSATDVLTIDYKLQSDQRTWIQTVTLKGAVVSTQTSYDGPLLQGGFGTGTECQQNCKGSVDWQYYTDTTIYLSAVDNAFPNTLGKGAGVVATPLYSNDGGKTWKVDSIAIPPMKIDSNGNPVTHTNTLTRTGGSTGTVKPTTTTKGTTSVKPTQTGTCAALYGQCGGSGWTGATCCSSGTCKYSNEWYSQCL